MSYSGEALNDKERGERPVPVTDGGTQSHSGTSVRALLDGFYHVFKELLLKKMVGVGLSGWLAEARLQTSKKVRLLLLGVSRRFRV